MKSILSGLGLGALALLPIACQTNPSTITDLDRATNEELRARGFDVAHYRIKMDLFPEERRVEAECRVQLVAIVDGLETVDLDLEDLDVASVKDARQRALQFEHSGGRLSVELAEPKTSGDYVELCVAYSGKPKKGLWFAGGLDEPTHVFTQGECEDSRWWFPCVDVPSERATHELLVTMPEDWVSVAGGVKLDSSVGAGRRFDWWRTTDPHPAYLTTLAAGEFVELQGDWKGLPLSWLAEARYAPWMDESLGETDEALEYLTELTGVAYPYDKYSQVCVENFPFGGMENISATTLTASALLDERGLRDDPPTGLVVHEATHQWYGDLLTCKQWSEIWLNEGFATYFTNVYFERSRGVDDFRVRMREAQEQYMVGDSGSNRRPIVHDVYRDPMDLFFGGHTYQGGATRLHLLRSVLGDEQFFAGLREYTAHNRNHSVETADLRESMELVSGEDLGWFFEQWLQSPGYPEFEVFWKYDEDRKQVLVTVDQTQKIGDGTLAAYRMPVGIEVRTEAGRNLMRFEIRRRRELFKIPSASRPSWVRFDKYGWIPGKVRARKTLEEWLLIAMEDDDVCGRLDALDALLMGVPQASDEQKLRVIEVFADRAREDDSPAVRRQALAAFAELRSVPAQKLLMEASAEDSVAACRATALRALARYPASEELASFAEQQFEVGFSWNTMGAAGELYRSAAPERAAQQLRTWMDVPSPHGRLRASLLPQLAACEPEDLLYDLAVIARDRSEAQAVRVAAVEALADYGRGSRDVSRILVKLLQGRDIRVRIACLNALDKLDDETTFSDLAAYYEQSIFPRERRILERILRGYSGS